MCGEWEVDLARRELHVGGRFVPIGSRAFEIIEVLVRSAGALITKDDLMARVWPGAIVEDNTLQVHISAVRKALGPDRGMLKTASGQGYRLLGSWTIRQESTAAASVALEPARSPVQPFLTNLPAAGFDLIGRASTVQHVQNLLSAYRVVTLTGPGGIGKTKLALEVARSLFPTFQGDVWLVELVSLSDPGLVPSAVAGVLGLQSGGGEISPDSVARAIGGKRPLLVLDNCEHVVDAAAELVETVVRSCPRTTILATSREILRVEGERVYRVPPLDVPTEYQKEPGNVVEHSAVQLFIARTSALDSEFAPHRENLPAIAAICRHLDGIPLAIEFAAARAAVFGPQQVASRLNDRFGLLTGGRRTALPRHQTLRAALDWSYQLLPEAEQRLLHHLAIFPSGFTLQAAASVTNDAPSQVAGGISNLVSKSLVTLDSSASTSRWRLLETIRAYALEKLVENGEAEQAARRHAVFFRDLFASMAPAPQLRPSAEDMERYRQEIDNVRAALDWAFSPVGEPTIGIVLTAAYLPAWLGAALLAECRDRSARALDRLDPGTNLSPQLEMQLHLALGLTQTYTLGPVDDAKRELGIAIEFAKNLDDLETQLQALWSIWVLHFNIGECHATQSITEQFSPIARRTGDKAVALVADRLKGYVLQHSGNQLEARHYFERVLKLYVPLSDQRYAAWTQLDQRVLARAMLARVLWLQGYADQATAQGQASLEEAQATQHRLSICEAIRLAVCPVALMTGDLVTAERAARTLIEIATSCNATFWRIVGRCLQGKLLIKRGEFAAGSDLLRAEFDTCERSGWAIWLPEFLGVLAEGLAGLGQFPQALAAVDQALVRADCGGERYYVAELLRIKGEFLLQEVGHQSISAAEDCFHRALALAQEQGALFWELRSALSLARLRVQQNHQDYARQLLAPVYSRFTEGFETTDLRSARAMLASLPS